MSAAEDEILLEVDVPSALAPDVHGEGTYTLYRCDITARTATRTVSWHVLKRYSHFHDLRETLFEALADKRFKRPESLVEAVELLPELPMKIYVGNSFARSVVEERRVKLRSFLQMVVALPDAPRLTLVQKFLRQPEEVLSPDPPKSARQVTYAGARPWVVPRGPTPADLPSPEEFRVLATRGWEVTGTMDPTYDGVYRLAGNGDSSHCTNAAHGQAHLYLGPTGKWYLNSAFSPQQDTCKAFYHRKSRRPSVDGIGLPTGMHPWQFWDRDLPGWEERMVQIEPARWTIPLFSSNENASEEHDMSSIENELHNPGGRLVTVPAQLRPQKC